jgi:hypothetical protein
VSVTSDSNLGDLLSLLSETPRHLQSQSVGLDDERLQRRPGANEWSANEILAHLRACADVWGGSIQAMIERDHPTLRYVSPRTWIRRTGYPTEPFADSLWQFMTQRDGLVAALRALDPVDWARGATFTGTTRGRTQTILSYVQRIVAHEAEHVQQIEATLQRA